jgi:F420-dependent methylenetetrahydromethanopterin dehydrogenase
MFGDRDWMNVKLSKNSIDEILDSEENSKKSKLEKLVVVKNCGHQMMFENPEATAKTIIKYFKKWSRPVDDSSCTLEGRENFEFSDKNVEKKSIGSSSGLNSMGDDACLDQAGLENVPDIFGILRKKAAKDMQPYKKYEKYKIKG